MLFETPIFPPHFSEALSARNLERYQRNISGILAEHGQDSANYFCITFATLHSRALRADHCAMRVSILVYLAREFEFGTHLTVNPELNRQLRSGFNLLLYVLKKTHIFTHSDPDIVFQLHCFIYTTLNCFYNLLHEAPNADHI